MHKSRTWLLVCSALLAGFIIGSMVSAKWLKVRFSQHLMAAHAYSLESSSRALGDFKAGKTGLLTWDLQNGVDLSVSMLESGLQSFPLTEKETSKYGKMLADAKTLQQAWHIAPGSFESTNGPGILTTNVVQ
jgi:hypothetical protein